MAKEKASKDTDITSVKAHRKTAEMITQLAALTRTNQQTVLDRYARFIEDDLKAALAKRQQELRGSRQN